MQNWIQWVFKEFFFCKVSKRSWTTISIVSINEGLDPIVIKVNKTE